MPERNEADELRSQVERLREGLKETLIELVPGIAENAAGVLRQAEADGWSDDLCVRMCPHAGIHLNWGTVKRWLAALLSEPEGAARG